ncbi:hypothetical protein B0H13DRAFT_2480149 [Mycena leptocephala]|nr:hypothetical protein B0H13DRAFT_2480149 [Mycena leptocephala]
MHGGDSVKRLGSDSVRACASVGGSMERRERMLENKDQITKQVESETERRTQKQRPHIEHDARLVTAVDEDGHRREGGGELCEVSESGSSGPRGRRVSEEVDKSVGWKDQDQTKHARDTQKQTCRPTSEGTEVGVYGQARHGIVEGRRDRCMCARWTLNKQRQSDIDVFIISRDVHAFTTRGEVGRRAKRWKDQGGAQVGVHGQAGTGWCRIPACMLSIKVRRLVLGLVRAAIADGEYCDAMRVGGGSELGSALAQGMGRRWVGKGEKTGKAKPKADGDGYSKRRMPYETQRNTAGPPPVCSGVWREAVRDRQAGGGAKVELGGADEEDEGSAGSEEEEARAGRS